MRLKSAFLLLPLTALLPLSAAKAATPVATPLAPVAPTPAPDAQVATPNAAPTLAPVATKLPETTAANTISWSNLARVFAERFVARSPTRVAGESAYYRSLQKQSLRFNPTIQGSWQENTQKITATQSSPWGTSLSGSYSEVKSSTSDGTRQRTVDGTLRQEVLKGGPWHGLAPVAINSLDDEVQASRDEQDYQTHVRDVMFAFIDGQLQFLREGLARKSLERAQAETTRIERDITQGYKAKTDLLVFQLAQNRARLAVKSAQDARSQALRALELQLWQRPGDAPLKVDSAAVPQHILSKLEAIKWPDETAALRAARLGRLVVVEKSNLANRDGLPSVGFWHTWSKSENVPVATQSGGTRYTSTSQRTYGLDFSLPLASTISREVANAAALDLVAAESQFEQEVLKDKAARQEAGERLATLHQRVEIARSNVDLAARSEASESEKYRDGRSTIQEFSRAQDDLAAAENGEVEARADLLKHLVQVALDTGSLRRIVEGEK